MDKIVLNITSFHIIYNPLSAQTGILSAMHLLREFKLVAQSYHLLEIFQFSPFFIKNKFHPYAKYFQKESEGDVKKSRVHEPEWPECNELYASFYDICKEKKTKKKNATQRTLTMKINKSGGCILQCSRIYICMHGFDE